MVCTRSFFALLGLCRNVVHPAKSRSQRLCIDVAFVLSKAFNLAFHSMLAFEINVFQAPAKPQETASQKAVKAKETLGHSAFFVCRTFFHSLTWNSGKGSAPTSFASYDGGTHPGVFVAWLEYATRATMCLSTCPCFFVLVFSRCLTLDTKTQKLPASS